MSTTLIHSARRFDDPSATGPRSAGSWQPGAWTSDAWMLFDGDTIAATGTVGGQANADASAPPFDLADRLVDAGGAILAPGFIDLHAHGGGGVAFDDGASAIATALAVHRAHGTTRSVVSLVTAELDVLADRLRVVADAASRDPLIVGAHLEGPFLAAGHKGAHDASLLRAPTPAALEDLLEAGAGRIVQVTLAPELPGADAAIARLVAHGIVVALGHTDADYETTRAAFDRGARILTHAFNGMNDIGHRAPGPVAAALDDERVVLELICDGFHVHPAVSRVAFAGAPGRVALITDAMAAAGVGDGDYLLGASHVEVRGGAARLAGGGSIAGSTLTLDAAVRHAVDMVGVPLVDAVRAVTEVPARAIGREAELGRLSPGYAADAVLLEHDLTVRSVWAAGRDIRG